MNFFNKNKKCDVHSSEVECGCNGNKKFRLNIINKDEFYFLPYIRLTLSDFEGNYFKGRNLKNGFRSIKFSFKFLNFIIEKEKKLKKEYANTSI